MIWYLLSPLRGTTQPPTLSKQNPVYKLFSNHGRLVARHPIIWMLISVAIAVLLTYPTVFLYSQSLAPGAAQRPHHVWTSALPFHGDENTQPDIEMRQVWIHGSFMSALNPTLLGEALKIQDALLGPRSTYEGYLLPTPIGRQPNNPVQSSNKSYNHNKDNWFFKSPLLYWNCSADEVARDTNILDTINAGSHLRTPLNITLRHRALFAGKRFHQQRLVAADALVVTCLSDLNSHIGAQWDTNAKALGQKQPPSWEIYPENGTVSRSQLYQFHFQPMSSKDDVMIAFAYLCTLVYVTVSLRRLRALRSRYGLIFTSVIQIAISIIASFTVCGLCNIDLSRIPQTMYPFVVLSIGIENMFRLINALMALPPELPTATRIASAVGDVGHLLVATAVQNLTILWFLSRVVSPGVKAFCVFAAVALLFDFFFHLTFFVAVLSVDVRRMELQDIFEQAESYTPTEPATGGWKSVLRNLKAPFSTRIAGSSIMVIFIAVLNWHFLDRESCFKGLYRYIQHVWSGADHLGMVDLPGYPVNQVRSHAAWLKMQDHESAKEVIQIMKPEAHSLIARVYDPLVFVWNGSDRRSNKTLGEAFVDLDFFQQHMMSSLLAVSSIVVLVAFLMSILLWNENNDKESNRRYNKKNPLVVETIDTNHKLDIVKLFGRGGSLLVSVGLDRQVCIWNLDENQVHCRCLPESEMLWPVIALAVDDRREWLAICSSKGRVSFWNLIDGKMKGTAQIDLLGSKIALFWFSPTCEGGSSTTSLIIVKTDGLMVELEPSTLRQTDLQICAGSLLSAQAASSTCVPPFVVSTSRNRGLHLTTREHSSWTLQSYSFQSVHAVVPLPELGVLLAVRSCEVDLVDIASRQVIRVFQIAQAKPQTLRAMHSRRLKCLCGAWAVEFFTFCYTDANTGYCFMHTFNSPQISSGSRHASNSVPYLCMTGKRFDRRLACCGFESADENPHWVENPGSWEITDSNVVLGVRQTSTTKTSDSTSSHSVPAESNTLRDRFQNRGKPSKVIEVEDDGWEAWSLSASGEFNTTKLNSTTDLPEYNGEENDLLVSSLGSFCKLGRTSVAAGFGNKIKIIRTGNGRLEDNSDELYEAKDTFFYGVNNRRKGFGRKSQ